MTLTMRLTGLAHGVYEDAMDYSVFAGAWNIGRIYERGAVRMPCGSSGHSTASC